MGKVLDAYQISEVAVPAWARGEWQFGLDCEIDYIDYPDGQRAYWHDWVLMLEDGSLLVVTDTAYRQLAATSARLSDAPAADMLRPVSSDANVQSPPDMPERLSGPSS